MKTMNATAKLAFGLVLLSVLFSACTPEQCNLQRTYTQYTPEYMSYTEFRNSVKAEAARAIENPGKIYFKDNLIYLNEFQKGVHIIDNSNPANPVKLSFINIPGNVDIAVRNNTLYADSWVDLVAIDVSNPNNPVETKRVQEVFPYTHQQYGVWLDENQGVVKEWHTEEITEEYVGDCNGAPRNGWGGWGFRDDMVVNQQAGFGGAANQGGGGGGSKAMPSTGIGGSMARFALYDQYLYVVTESNMMLFDVAIDQDPKQMKMIELGWGIETIFPYQDKLFIGANNGMYIYDNADPANPEFESQFEHVTTCDPVVVEDDIAYVTLRNGTPCWGWTNQLDILDVSNTTNPTLIATHPMFNPHGLGIDSKTAFICDGAEGLKIYDVNDPESISLLSHFKDINTYDVIPLPNKDVLLMVGDDGFYQYDYSDLSEVELLSTLLIGQ